MVRPGSAVISSRPGHQQDQQQEPNCADEALGHRRQWFGGQAVAGNTQRYHQRRGKQGGNAQQMHGLNSGDRPGCDLDCLTDRRRGQPVAECVKIHGYAPEL